MHGPELSESPQTQTATGPAEEPGAAGTDGDVDPVLLKYIKINAAPGLTLRRGQGRGKGRRKRKEFQVQPWPVLSVGQFCQLANQTYGPQV